MTSFQQGSRAGDRFTRLSLEQLESRDVPSPITFAVATTIVHSQEAIGDVVTADYARFLGRSPDTAGFNFLTNQLQNGTAPEFVEAEFVSSSEYIRNHGGVFGGWIPGLYNDLLGRLPSTSELNFWSIVLSRGTSTATVGLDFTTSVERDAIVVSADYIQLLGRTADPAGLNFFVGALRSGANRFAVTSTIMGSTEFFVHNGITNTGFVIGAFHDILNRTPNNNELNFFLNILNNG
jgi:hypothetical protein